MGKEKYDFAGYVTKNDTLCSDGVVIRHGAFADQDGAKVPLVWQHNHNSPDNVIGHVDLKNTDIGVYGFGYLNKGAQAQAALESIRHGDIDAMSIYANRIKRQGPNITHGQIIEVSLVMKGANPGALIDSVSHADGSDSDEEAILYGGNLIHLEEDEPDAIKHSGGNTMSDDETKTQTQTKPDDDSTKSDTKQDSGEETVGSVLDTLNEKQKQAVETIIGEALKQKAAGTDESHDETDDAPSGEVSHSENGGKQMAKHNVFDNDETLKQQDNGGKTLTHSEIAEIFDEAKDNKASLKDTFIQHGITNIEVLFPEAKTTGAPSVLRPTNTSAQEIVNSITKSPFSRVRTIVADLTTEGARANGYIKGDQKIDQVYGLLTRKTEPQTIYKKQKLDRDDVIDAEEMDVVSFTQQELRDQLTEEIARAVLVGDGREVTDPQKIQEDRIRPIAKDAGLFTAQVTVGKVADFLESVINALPDYQGSGMPNLYIDPILLAKIRLQKATDGRYLFGNGGIPSTQEIAAQLEVSKIVPTKILPKGEALIVNLSDYQLGASKGGEVTTFDDFDIDFNQMKYLIETRISGALNKPRAAIHIKVSESLDATGSNPFADSKETGADTKPQAKSTQPKPASQVSPSGLGH